MSGIDFDSGYLQSMTSAPSAQRGFLDILGGVGGAATIFAGGLSAYGSMVKASAAAGLAGATADQLRDELGLVRKQARAAERARQDAFNQTFATQIALQAARGIDIGSAGSTQRIAEVTRENFEADMDLLRDYVAARESSIEHGIEAYKEQKKAAEKSGKINTGSAIVGTISALNSSGALSTIGDFLKGL